MSTLPNKDTQPQGMVEQIVEIGLKHHCLGCVADGVFCPTYEELPAKYRGARDSLVVPIQALINSEADRRVIAELEALEKHLMINYEADGPFVPWSVIVSHIAALTKTAGEGER